MTRTSYQERCTKEDYRRLFAASAEPLRWLCYTLTGDETLSEQLLNAALEQSLKGADQVFRDWMVSWARRLIIRACIATVRPAAEFGLPWQTPLPARQTLDSEVTVERLANLPPDVLQFFLLRLEPLQRFVFVLRAIERYSRRETALLLDLDDRSCDWIYETTTHQLSATLPSDELASLPAVSDVDGLSAIGGVQ